MPARTAQLLLVLTLFAATGGAVTGCDSEQGGGRGTRSHTPDPVAKARARQVADAWDGSEAARAWRKGYYPMGETVQLPEHAFHDGDDKQAYEAQSFVLRGELPAAPRKNGQVK
ncbi:hypothetical protein ACWGQ5_01395 [Streptomyces sp. NPDC055722]